VRVGWVGLGKLGLPCALAMSDAAGVDIAGYDISPEADNLLSVKYSPRWQEENLVDLIQANLGRKETGRPHLASMDTVEDVVLNSDLIFVAVQTPHSRAYDGSVPAPEEKRDFEYGYLRQSVQEISQAAADLETEITIVVISTALPGSVDRELIPGLPKNVKLIYNPFFIAMGTTVWDFLNPEFVLIGCRDEADVEPLRDLYALIHDRPLHVTDYKSAELTKVAYNTFISMKIVFANTMMELCHKIGADADSVRDALALATDRVISPAYMRGGMGDGGACHPRDNIAMSWLAQRYDLSVDPFDFVTRSREAQSEWLASLAERWSRQSALPIMILGTAYKPDSDLQYGSPALLLLHQLSREERKVRVTAYDPIVEGPGQLEYVMQLPRVFVIGINHTQFADYQFPVGSVVIDPHNIIKQQTGVTLVKLGRP